MTSRVLVDLRTQTPPLVEVWLATHTTRCPDDTQTPLDPAYVLQGLVDGARLFGAAPATPAEDGVMPLTLVWPPGQRYQLRSDTPQRLVLQVDGVRGQRIRGVAPHATLRGLDALPDGGGMAGRFELRSDNAAIALYWRHAV